MSQSKYTYCFVGVDSEAAEGRSVGTGVENEPAYVHVIDGLGAVVHDCSPEAYDTDDREQAEEWVTQHNHTIERAASEFGSVLPMTFDTIFESESGVREFLATYDDQITTRLSILAGTEEYGVRIYCQEELLVDGAEASTDTGETGGLEYFEEMKREEQRKAEIAESMKDRFQEYFRRINAVVDEITEGDLEDDDDRGRNVLTASCLVDEEHTSGLKNELGEINDEEGVEVVFTGPWLPYTFVGSLGEEAPEG